MRQGVPSRTAFAVALRRAAHQLLDHPCVFPDPIALKIVGGRIDFKGFDSRNFRTLRAFVAARSRCAEDELASFVAQGGTQYVVVGAGLDTFAYRNPYAPGLTVFEVDHPDTQAWKMELLRRAGISVPPSLLFVPVDFDNQTLAKALEESPHFETQRRAFFSWLGVTPYLKREAFESTLEFISSMPPDSQVVFDYTVPASSVNLRDKIALKFLSVRVAQVGEAFRTFLDPQGLAALLRGMRFTSIEDLGCAELNSRYFQGRGDGLRIRSGIGRIAIARI